MISKLKPNFFGYIRVLNIKKKTIFNDEFFPAGIYNFYQLAKADGDLFSCDEMVIRFKITPNKHSFINYVKLILALPLIWLNENCTLSAAFNFNKFKEKTLTQIELLNKSNRTVYDFFA